MSKQDADLEPQEDAKASPEELLENDGSVDSSIEPDKAEAESEEVKDEKESEAESSTADEENVEEIIDTPDAEFSDKVKERIDKLTANFREEQRASAEKDLRIEELQKQIDDTPQETEPFKSLEDFEYDNTKYQLYMGAEIDKRATAAAERVAKGFQAEESSASRQDAFRRREKAFAETVKDYHEVVYGEVDGRRHWQASDAVAKEIQLSDMGEQLAYHLASNPDIAAEISRLPERETIRRIVLIEERLISEKAKKANKVSKAPPPTPKIKAGDPGLSKGFYEGMSDKDFDKERRKQIANR